MTTTGLEKTALLLLSIGEEPAAKVMQQLDEQAVNNLSLAMSRVKRVDTEAADQVLHEFVSQFDERSSDSVNGADYLRQTLVEALGASEAERVMEHIFRDGSMSTTMDILRDVDPAALAEQVRNERPQTIALILAHIDPAAGSALLSHFSEALARDVLLRYASLDSVQPHVLKELTGTLDEQLSGELAGARLSDLGGSRKAADILNNLHASSIEQLLSGVESIDAELAESIRENMFTFSDLVQLSSPNLQRLLRDVDNDELVSALKAAPPEVVDKVLSNVSSRAAEAIREDLDSGPAVRRSEAESAQKNIIRIARALDRDGEITISSDEDLL